MPVQVPVEHVQNLEGQLFKKNRQPIYKVILDSDSQTYITVQLFKAPNSQKVFQIHSAVHEKLGKIDLVLNNGRVHRRMEVDFLENSKHNQTQWRGYLYNGSYTSTKEAFLMQVGTISRCSNASQSGAIEVQVIILRLEG